MICLRNSTLHCVVFVTVNKLSLRFCVLVILHTLFTQDLHIVILINGVFLEDVKPSLGFFLFFVYISQVYPLYQTSEASKDMYLDLH